MKNVLQVFVLLLSTSLLSQSIKSISGEWASFDQEIDINISTPRKFKLRVTAKIESQDKHAFSSLYALVRTKDGEHGFYLTMEENPIKSQEWQTFELSGTITPNTKKLMYGGLSFYNGLFYFDFFELYLEDEYGMLKSIPLKNSSFEKKVDRSIVPNWHIANKKDEVLLAKGFVLRTSPDAVDGKSSLLFEGKGINTENLGVIVKNDSETPQIDAMISMLNDLKARVVDHSQYLSQHKTDYLLDTKANRIGALIMHLAATEALYQVVTFEGRKFNNEEKEKWQIALELGPKAQEKFQGESIKYYLDIYKEVRKKTITELKKRDDEWFKKIQPIYQWSNHYCWFHVMEHQSSHLGQILFLKKRIPPEGEISIVPEMKD